MPATLSVLISNTMTELLIAEWLPSKLWSVNYYGVV